MLREKPTGEIRTAYDRNNDLYLFEATDTEAKRFIDILNAYSEPIRINLNEIVKVKLTDVGKDIFYHRYDEINQIAGKEILKPEFPKEDENGYTKFPLWDFMRLYGKHIGIGLPNVIEPIEIVYEGERHARLNQQTGSDCIRNFW